MDFGGSSGSCESKYLKVGFKFGQQIYFEDVGVGVQANSGGGSSTADGRDGDCGAQKKGRTEVGLQQQPPRCQVEGCNVDLSDAKTYYLRHKVCDVHSKTAIVIVNGVQQRFCQQCSRFHRLPEFDQGKRSCRRRLAGHNERRRKPPPGTIVSTRYGKLSSSIFENHARPGGFVMDLSTVQWSNTRSSAHVANNNIPTRTEKLEPLLWQTPIAESPFFVNPSIISDRALSLLSNQSSGSRNQTLSLECYVNPCAPVVQPVSGGGTDGATMGQFSSTASWGYVANESYEVLQPGYLGEPELGQGASRYDSTDRV